MSSKKPVLIASRICTKTRGNYGTGADNEDLTGFDKTQSFIVVAQIDEESGPWTSTYTLRWRNVTDSGTFANLASTGQCKWATDTDLANGTNLETGTKYPTGDRLCNATGGSGSVWYSGEEVEGAATCESIALPDEDYTEVHFAVSLADAHDGDQYEFELYENTGPSSVGTLQAQITTGVAPAGSITETVNLNEGITDAGMRAVGAVKGDRSEAINFEEAFGVAGVVKIGEEQFNSNAQASSQSINIPSDCTLLVVCLAGYESGKASIFGASATLTIGGAAMTMQQDNGTNGASMQTAIWTKTNPETGPRNLEWAWFGFTGTADYGVGFYCYYLKNVNTSDPVRDKGGQQTLTATATCGTLNVQAGDVFLGVGNCWATPSLPSNIAWTNADELYDQSNNGERDGSAWKSGLSSSTEFSITATSSSNTTISGIVIKASSIAATPKIGDLKPADVSGNPPYEALNFQEYVAATITGAVSPRDVEITELLTFDEGIDDVGMRIIGALKTNLNELYEAVNFEEGIAQTGMRAIGALKTDDVNELINFHNDPQYSITEAPTTRDVQITETLGFEEGIAQTGMRAVGALKTPVDFSEVINLQEGITDVGMRAVGTLKTPVDFAEAINLQEGISETGMRQIGAVQGSTSELLQGQEGIAEVGMRRIGTVQAETSDLLKFEIAPDLVFSRAVEVEEVVRFESELTRRLGTVEASVSETISFEINPDIGGDRIITVTETIDFEEAPSYQITQAPQPQVSENVNFAEDITRELSVLKVAVEETINLAEGIAEVGMRAIGALKTDDVKESIEFNVSPSPSVAQLSASVSGILNFVEEMFYEWTGDRNISVSEAVIIQETIQGLLEELKTGITEALNFAENNQAWIGELNPPVIVEIVENINFTEAQITLPRFPSPTDFKKEFIIPPSKGADREFFIG